MRKFVFYIAYPLLWLVSKLPFPLFYLFSDFIYVVVYYLIGYRKKVVRGNLELCFPHKSTEELKKIEKAFYHHMCDMFLEMIKTLSISKKQSVQVCIGLLQPITNNVIIYINIYLFTFRIIFLSFL